MATTFGSRQLISVVIPTYNRARLVPRAIESALSQTWRDIEVIVVDDGSTDETFREVRAFRDARVRLERRGSNGGPSLARNEGIQAARGDWVAFLDSDDEWLPEKLERQVERLVRDEFRASVVYCQAYLCDALIGRMGRGNVVPYEGDVFERLLGGWIPFPTSGLLAKRAALCAVGGFDAAFPLLEDYDLWLRLAEASHRFAVVDLPLVIVHQGVESRLTTDPVARLLAFRIFDLRWRPVVEGRLGSAAYRKMRAGRLANIQRARWTQVRLAVLKGDRWAAWKHCLEMVRFLPRSRRFVLRALRCAASGRVMPGGVRVASTTRESPMAGHTSSAVEPACVSHLRCGE
jgi:glycosyltransferase involved in cell wall biosynthesis